MKKYNPKSIFCPQCYGNVGTWDGRSTIPKSAKCSHCNKLIVYNPETKKTRSKQMPQRHCGSGMRFY